VALNGAAREDKIQWGRGQLDVVRRFALVSSMYPDEQSVLSKTK
jgi:hypothetical protein